MGGESPQGKSKTLTLTTPPPSLTTPPTSQTSPDTHAYVPVLLIYCLRSVCTHGREDRGGRGDDKEAAIYLWFSTSQRVDLHKAAKPWVPVRAVEPERPLTEEEKTTQKIYRKFQGILNKLTPQKFQALAEQALKLEINTEERLRGVIDKIFTCLEVGGAKGDHMRFLPITYMQPISCPLIVITVIMKGYFRGMVCDVVTLTL